MRRNSIDSVYTMEDAMIAMKKACIGMQCCTSDGDGYDCPFEIHCCDLEFSPNNWRIGEHVED